MGSEEKIDVLFREELEKCMEGEKLRTLPVTIRVEQDDVPDIERWRTHE